MGNLRGFPKAASSLLPLRMNWAPLTTEAYTVTFGFVVLKERGGGVGGPAQTAVLASSERIPEFEPQNTHEKQAW